MIPRVSQNQRGLSLTELLVASAMIGIVTLGMTGFTVMFTTMERTSEGAGSGAIQVTGAASALRRDIQAAIGDRNNPGILFDDNRQILVMRHEVGLDPANYLNDTWVCWVVNGRLLQRTVDPISLATQVNPPTPTTVAQCQDRGQTRTYLTTPVQNFFEVVVNGTRIDFVTLNLTYRLDPAAAADPMANPETTFTTSVNPAMISE
jgi:prepilin-type N-terminal cleavage/methylation domain-containing protein